MPQLLTLSRAARLVGVTRSTLQKQIQNGELSTFEGQLAVTELLRAYPNATMQDTTAIERVERIKATTGYDHGRQNESALPSPKVLATRLTSLSKELVWTKSELNKYSDLIEKLLQKCRDAETMDEANLRSHIVDLQNWLTTELKQHSPKFTEPAVQLLAKDTVLRIMAAHVKVIPSGHDFFVEGNDSILEAALRGGLAFNYGCTGGSCGLCKARIVSGEVQKIQNHDYVISEAEKNMGYRLMCSYTAVTDITVEAAEAHSVADIPLQQTEAKVKKLEPFQDNVLVLHLQTPRTQTLRFLAGQTATLMLEDDVSADYYIASCPCDGRNLEFHLHKTPNDKVTDIFFDRLKTGQKLNIEGPQGDFVLQEDSTRPALFLTDTHGFAPIKSLIEHAIALDIVPSFHLHWITSNEGGHYQNNWCRSRADALDNFYYNPLMVAQDDSQLKSVLSKMFEGYANFNDFEVYLSGDNAFVAVVQEVLSQYHLPETQLHATTK
jgi:CDP-4-dehydro-6-deoxyglucose reductase, E3